MGKTNFFPSRRGFLTSLTAAGAVATWSPSLNWAAEFCSISDRPVFATIGLRNQGWLITQKFLPYADLAALVDVDRNVLNDNISKAIAAQSKKP